MNNGFGAAFLKNALQRQNMPRLFAVKDNPSRPAGLVHVNHTLVPASAELQGKILLFKKKRAVDQDVCFRKQTVNFRPMHRGEGFEGIAGIYGNVLSFCVDKGGETRQGLRLAEGFPAAESNSLQKRIFAEFRKNLLNRLLFATLKRMRLRVMTAGAVVRTALHKNGIPKAVPVYNGFVYNSGEPECFCIHKNSPLIAKTCPLWRSKRAGNL